MASYGRLLPIGSLARQLEGKLLEADVFLPITPGPIDLLKKAGRIDLALPVASTQMVIAYSPKSKFVPEFESAAQGKKNWYDVLGTPGLRFGRTDHLKDRTNRPSGRSDFEPVLRAQPTQTRR